jgi:hypothetical protein
VQVIHLSWTKAARGGEGARARCAVPAAFEVPASELVDVEGVLRVDASHWGDRNCFAAPFRFDRQEVQLSDGFVVGCVTISAWAEGLQVGYRYDPAVGGAPDRRAFAPAGHRESATRTLPVHDGEWVRVCHNGRFSCIDTGNWWYEQVTVNVACFVGEPNGRVFLEQEPTQELRALAELW